MAAHSSQRRMCEIGVLLVVLPLVFGATVVDPGVNFPLEAPPSGSQGAKLDMLAHPMFQQSRQENLSSESVTASLAEGAVIDEATEVNVKVMAAKDARKTSAESCGQTVPIYFSLAEIPQVSDVTVCGSWSHWMDHYKLSKSGDDFDGVIDLPVGKHQFKFIIDGEWTTSSQWPITYDKEGQTNNVIDVQPPKYAKGVALRKFHNELADEIEPTKAATGVGAAVKNAILLPFRAFGALLSLMCTPFKLMFGLLGAA